MDEKIRQLYKEVEEKERLAKAAKVALDQVINSCKHEFGQTEYVPIHHEAYDIPADGAGSDWRPSCHVPATTEDRWKRTCGYCGKTEYTKETIEEVKSRPKW